MLARTEGIVTLVTRLVSQPEGPPTGQAQSHVLHPCVVRSKKLCPLGAPHWAPLRTRHSSYHAGPTHSHSFATGWSPQSLVTRRIRHLFILFRKILAPIKIKSALPPPQTPPPKTRNLMDMGFPAERTHFFQVSIKLAQPFPAPELRTRILRTRGFF